MAILTTCFIVLAIFVPVLGYPVGKRPTGDEWKEYVPFFDWDEWKEYCTFLDFDIKGLLKDIPIITIGSNFYLNCLATILVLVKAMKKLFKIGRMVLCYFPCCRKGQTSRGFTGTLGRILERPVSGWQEAWENLGKLVGRVTPPIIWDFTPEQVSNPDEMARCLVEGCLSYDDPNTQFLALCWGLATAYGAAIDHYQKPRAEAEGQTMSPETNDAPIESTDIGIQTQPEISTISTKLTECGTQTQPEIRICRGKCNANNNLL